MNPLLKEILEEGITRNLSGEPIKVNAQISAKEGELIRKCITGIEAEVSVEVGLAFGTSALFICESLLKSPATKHYVIDPFQNYEASYGGIGLNNLRKSGFENIVEFIDKPSQLALPELVQRGIKADFAFIDGWHTFDHALVDFFFVDRLLRTGGIVILDDTDWPGIRKLASFIITNRSYEFVEGTPPRSKSMREDDQGSRASFFGRKLSGREEKTLYGAMAFRKTKVDERNWDHFNDFK